MYIRHMNLELNVHAEEANKHTNVDTYKLPDSLVHVHKSLKLSVYMMNTFLYILLAVVNCGTLTDPANGEVDHTAGTTYQQTVTYSCDTGYNLVGDSTRICQATGVWSGSAPTCLGTL